MDDEFEAFNLETMAGVFPGSRTAQFERIQISPETGGDGELIWARVLWYDEPRAGVVYLHARASADQEALLHVPVAEAMTLIPQLETAFQDQGYQLHACGTCQYWRPTTTLTDDQLPSGHCAWRHDETESPPAVALLSAQSGLALSCLHWQVATGARPASRLEAAQESLPRAAVAHKEQEQRSRSLWSRLQSLFGAKDEPPRENKPGWSGQLQEQSGVGAGTEPCLACQGRIANLGAEISQTAQGDQQAFSVWRCRRCHTLYLNHWIDRWVRLDTLETVERYFRLAPAEAVAVLAHIQAKTGEDPFMSTIASRPPLNTQVKHGR